jgi:hypothetical protein
MHSKQSPASNLFSLCLQALACDKILRPQQPETVHAAKNRQLNFC